MRTSFIASSCPCSGCRVEGFVTDYAFLIRGLLDMYEAGLDARWVEWAQALQCRQDELFWDDAAGAYYVTTNKDESVLLRRVDGQCASLVFRPSS